MILAYRAHASQLTQHQNAITFFQARDYLPSCRAYYSKFYCSMTEADE